MSKFDAVWRSLESTVASGWVPGIVAGARHAGETEFFATGVRTLGESAPMLVETPFRISSLSKPIAGALTALLIADGMIALDDPVERWLPELANPRVLVTPDAPLDQTVAAERPITVRHLLTMTNGLGVVFADTPLSRAIRDAEVGASALPPQMSHDEFMARLGALPLAYQPGERWMYHTPADILSVLLARAGNAPLRDVLRKYITGPLGMESTAFLGSGAQLPTAYVPTPEGLTAFDPPDGAFARTPQFETLAGGLVSTISDYIRFLSALADDVLLPPGLKHQMTSDQLTASQRDGMVEWAGPAISWGWQVAVYTATSEPWTSPGRYGWDGGTGTSAYTDPSRDLIGAILTQRLMTNPDENFAYFWEPLAAVV